MEWFDVSKKQLRYQLDKVFYDRVRGARSRYKLVRKLTILPYNGLGFVVSKGHTFRVIEETGPQIADVAFWNAHNPDESFGAMRTWMVEGWIIRPDTRLWSELPWFRPMMTCIDDTVVPEADADYHHHFMGTHCASETVQMGYGLAGLNACRLNLFQAIQPFGLKERNLRENINVHEKDQLDPKTGRRSIARGDERPGDYIEFYAEMDLLVAVSVCPFGDGSADPTMYEEGVVRPLGIEIYDTGIEPQTFPTWTDWRPARTGRRSLPQR